MADWELLESIPNTNWDPGHGWDNQPKLKIGILYWNFLDFKLVHQCP